MVFGTKQGAAMKLRVLQIVGVVAVVVACLSAQVALLAIGNSFRIAARMADSAPVVVSGEGRPSEVAGIVQIAAVTDQDRLR